LKVTTVRTSSQFVAHTFGEIFHPRTMASR
jgi:hypothetical protein